jgi:hypothetical protein
MTRTDPFIDQLKGYLDEYEGFTPLPDEVRDSVRAKLPRSTQVGSLRGPMKYLNLTMAMPAPVRYGLVAAVLVVAAAVGTVFFRSTGNVGVPPTPTPLPTSTSAVLIEPGSAERPLAAGTYYIDAPFPMRITFDLPQDWVTWGYTPKASQINLNDAGGGSPPGEVSFEIIDNITADPCTNRLLNPPVGPSVDDLVSALSSMKDFEATPATDVTIDGFHGKQFTLTAPADPQCGSLLTWKTTTRQNGVGSGEVNEVRILDVDGVRLLICIAYTPPLPAGTLDELEGIVDSVQITP